MAQWLKEAVDAHPDFIRVGDTPFALVAFQSREGNRKTEALIDALNATQKIFVSPARIKGNTVLRVSIGSAHTRAEDVKAAWALIQSVYSTLDLD
jgi:aromatic-L-amino-acid decarboxylase